MPELRNRLFIANDWKAARDGRTYDVVDPSTEEILTTVSRGGPEDVGNAVTAAADAMKGPWGRPSQLMPGAWLEPFWQRIS